jgi:23S rRNA (uridine2552-2'-O)-methyltransferase
MYRKDKKDEFYTRKAREEKYPARSVYKLKEIDDKYKLIKKGDRVLDLGAAPGSWMFYISQQVGEKGEVVGVDIGDLKISLASNMIFMRKDIVDLEVEKFIEPGKQFDLVLSDLAPKTTGIKSVDATNSLLLCDKALAIAKLVLKKGGSFVCKIFEGNMTDKFFKEIKKEFKFAKAFRPEAVLKGSKEIYIIGIGYGQ